MKAFFAVVVAAAVVATASAASIQEKHPIDWYSCAGKPDGNYKHPWRCTAFVSCSGGIASERECAECHVDPVRCPAGQTVYDPATDRCEWADETQCSAGTPPPNNNGTTTTATEATTPDNGGGNTTPDGGATEEPTTTPNPGETCDPHLCKTKGYCDHYFRCNNVTKVWDRLDCGKDLVWNPDGPAGEHGGNCDVWANLSPAVRDRYRKDKNCFACYWKEIGKCNRNYLYQHPDLTTRLEQELSCGHAKLVFVEELETCIRCDIAKDAAGNPCCPPFDF